MNNTRTKVWSTLLSFALATSVTGCGTGAAQQVQAICSEANAAIAQNSIVDVVMALPDSDWTGFQADYSDLSDELLTLSDRASDAGDTQLARDLASVSRDARSISAVAALIATVGFNNATVQELQGVNLDFINNEALRSPSDQTLIGCN